MHSLTIVLERDNDGAGPDLLVSVTSTECPGGCPFEDAKGRAFAVAPRSGAGLAVAEVVLHASPHGALARDAVALDDVRAAIYYAARVLL